MEKIKKLKQLFKKVNIDGYIVPKNDEYFGEYILIEMIDLNTFLVFQDRTDLH